MQNVLIGPYACPTDTGSNRLYIENTNTASPLIFVEFDNDLVRINDGSEVMGSFSIENTLADEEGNTNIQVETTAGEAVIRFNLAGNFTVFVFNELFGFL